MRAASCFGRLPAALWCSALCATAWCCTAAAQDPAYVGGGRPDAAAVGQGRATPAPPAIAPATTRSTQAPLAKQWQALTRPTAQSYREAYGHAMPRDLPPEADARLLQVMPDLRQPPASSIDPRALEAASDQFARTLGPVLRQLRNDVDAQLHSGP